MVEPRAKNEIEVGRLIQNPWSWPVLATALSIAFVYPVVIAFGQWAFTDAVDLGAMSIFPDHILRSFRIIALFVVILMIVTQLAALIFENEKMKTFSAWLGAGFLLIAAAVSNSISDTSPFAMAFSGTLVAIYIGPIAVSFMVGFALGAGLLISVASILTLPIRTVLSMVTAAFGALYTGFFVRKKLGVAGYLSLVAVAVTALLYTAGTGELTPLRATIVVLWVILPCVNAIFDWISYGLTIYLMRKGFTGNTAMRLFLALVDAAAAVVLMTLLCATFVILMSLVDNLRPDLLFDVKTLLTELRDTPGAHLWIIVTVCSTLLPTGIHLIIGFLSVLTWVPTTLWDKLIAQLGNKHDPQSGWLSSMALAGATALYVPLPLFLLYAAWYGVSAAAEPYRLWLTNLLLTSGSNWGLF